MLITFTHPDQTKSGLGGKAFTDRKLDFQGDRIREGFIIEVSAEKYVLLGKAQVLKGRESWGPMALAGGRLIVRDLTRVVCLDVAAK